jgi:uncharacterized protein (DUF2236 family)
MAVVTRSDLERRIEQVRAQVRDPRAGLYGPCSVSWKVNREAVVMLGGGRAALLQLAHPYVAHAIDQHSATRSDPIGRFQRTFAHVFAMVFGDLDHAIESARRVHRIHADIEGSIREDVGAFRKGHRYFANDTEALFWVHATLVDSALLIYEMIVGPLAAHERERYYAESRLFAYLFGIPDEVMPADFAAFRAYVERMMESNVIAVGEPARQMQRFLFRPPRAVHAPLVAWYRIFTAGLLPPRLRRGFELPFGPREEAIFRRSIPWLRAARRITPRRLRYFPDYVEACLRIAGKPARDPFGRLLEQIAMHAITPARRGPSAQAAGPW